MGLAASLLNFPLAPLVVLFASDSGWLPKWLWWFQTDDNSLDGDAGWKEEHRPFKLEDTLFKRWWNRFHWLYRNSMYGFSNSVLGGRLLPTDKLITEGDVLTANNHAHSGMLRYFIEREGKRIYWQTYYVRQWGNSAKCIRLNLGWKLWNFKEGDPTSDMQPQFVFSPNPLQKFWKS